jgi:hypothetical protein
MLLVSVYCNSVFRYSISVYHVSQCASFPKSFQSNSPPWSGPGLEHVRMGFKKMKGDTICVDTILTFVKEQHLPETSTMSETYLTFLKNKHPETSTIV